MKYKFEVNGSIKLIIEPQTNLEREMFKELFNSPVEVTLPVSTNSSGEVIIFKKDAKEKAE